MTFSGGSEENNDEILESLEKNFGRKKLNDRIETKKDISSSSINKNTSST